MRTAFVATVAFAVCFVGVERTALGHGGQYRNPGGGVPPGLRPPGDPTPPPPPPVTQPPPPVTEPGTPPPATPPTTPPGTPPATPITGLGDPAARPTRSPTQAYDNWTYWWVYNKEPILRLKEALYRLRSTGGGGGLTEFSGDSANRTGAMRATEKAIREEVVPALLVAMDARVEKDPDARSAAYLALAKVTEDPAHLRLLLRGASREDGAPNDAESVVVRESAALSVGLLRRTDPARRFDAKMLDEARDALFALLEDGRHPTRTRAFAAYAIGLLGDQPTREPTAASRLARLLTDPYPADDLPVAVLTALSLQPPTSISPETLDALRECTLKARLFGKPASPLLTAHAAEALGRVGLEEHAQTLALVLSLRTAGTDVRRSAAVALGRMAPRLDPAGRAETAAAIVKAFPSLKDASTRAFALMAVAETAAADLKRRRTDVLDAHGGAVGDWLLSVAEQGAYLQQPFGALALGVVCREIDETAPTASASLFRERAIPVLRRGLDDPRHDPRSRGAFAVALGLAKDDGARKRLLEVLSDRRQDTELRGYAAVAIGMIGGASPPEVAAIEGALAERLSDELRLQCATALGLLGVARAVPVLLKELQAADTQNLQGQIVSALGRIGDARSIAPLAALLSSQEQPDLTRAMACVGLGLVGDLESVPSLCLVTSGINYRATTDALRELLSIL